MDRSEPMDGENCHRDQPAAAACCPCRVSPLAGPASAYFSHTVTERKQMRGNYKSIRKRFLGSGALVISRLTFCVPLDFINGIKITV